jgi:hypothetical protein
MDFGNQCGDRALGIVLESKGNYLSRRMRMPGRLGSNAACRSSMRQTAQVREDS